MLHVHCDTSAVFLNAECKLADLESIRVYLEELPSEIQSWAVMFIHEVDGQSNLDLDDKWQEVVVHGNTFKVMRHKSEHSRAQAVVLHKRAMDYMTDLRWGHRCVRIAFRSDRDKSRAQFEDTILSYHLAHGEDLD